jgi:hypothetical protein
MDLHDLFDLVIEFIGPLYNLFQHFTNHCLLLGHSRLLATLYTNPLLSLAQVKVKVTLRLTVSQSVSQSVSKSWCRAPSGAHDQIFITV